MPSAVERLIRCEALVRLPRPRRAESGSPGGVICGDPVSRGASAGRLRLQTRPQGGHMYIGLVGLVIIIVLLVILLR
jgi:hypothetical protein